MNTYSLARYSYIDEANQIVLAQQESHTKKLDIKARLLRYTPLTTPPLSCPFRGRCGNVVAVPTRMCHLLDGTAVLSATLAFCFFEIIVHFLQAITTRSGSVSVLLSLSAACTCPFFFSCTCPSIDTARCRQEQTTERHPQAQSLDSQNATTTEAVKVPTRLYSRSSLR